MTTADISQILPYELVAAIGDHLAPKWRCRLFMCCKLWLQKCYQDDLFKIYKNMYLNLMIIRNIHYNILIVKNVSISKIIKPNGNTIYSKFKHRYNNANTTIVNKYELSLLSNNSNGHYTDYELEDKQSSHYKYRRFKAQYNYNIYKQQKRIYANVQN